MYSIFESVINKGGYKLGEMLERIELYSAKGKLTISEMEELEKLAREKANMQNETDVLGMLLEHEERIRALEMYIGMSEAPEVDENGAVVAPEYVAGKLYYAGNRVMWQGEVYTCIAPEGAVCVWSPTEHPAYWSAE